MVQYIFQSYLKGSGYRRIADALNNKGIKTPSQYHQIKTGGKLRWQSHGMLFMYSGLLPMMFIQGFYDVVKPKRKGLKALGENPRGRSDCLFRSSSCHYQQG
ncbi:hypothetical protein JCM11672_36730 [Alkaliphilus crotonatoxidans]